MVVKYFDSETDQGEYICWIPWANNQPLGAIRWATPDVDESTVEFSMPPPPQPVFNETTMDAGMTYTLPSEISSWRTWSVRWTSNDIDVDEENRVVVPEDMETSTIIRFEWEIEDDDKQFRGALEVEVDNSSQEIYDGVREDNRNALMASMFVNESNNIECLVHLSEFLSNRLISYLDGRPLSRIKINFSLAKGDVIQGRYAPKRYGQDGEKFAFTLTTCQVVRLVNQDFKFRIRFEYAGMRPFTVRGIEFCSASLFEILPTLDVEFEPSSVKLIDLQNEQNIAIRITTRVENYPTKLDWFSITASTPSLRFKPERVRLTERSSTTTLELKRSMLITQNIPPIKFNFISEISHECLESPISKPQITTALIDIEMPSEPYWCWGDEQRNWGHQMLEFQRYQDSITYNSLKNLPLFPSDEHLRAQLNYREGNILIQEETERIESFGQLQHLGELVQLEPLVVKSESIGRFETGDEGKFKSTFITDRETVVIGTILITTSNSSHWEVSAPRHHHPGRVPPQGYPTSDINPTGFKNGRKNVNSAIHFPSTQGFYLMVFSSEDILGSLWMDDESLSFNEFVERFKQVASPGDEEGSELIVRYGFIDVVDEVGD